MGSNGGLSTAIPRFATPCPGQHQEGKEHLGHRRNIHAFGFAQILQVSAFDAFVFFVVFSDRYVSCRKLWFKRASAGAFIIRIAQAQNIMN